MRKEEKGMEKSEKGIVKDIRLAAEGLRRIEFVAMRMPVLGLLRERFKEEKPLKGVKITACLHVTTETAVLLRTLKEQ